MQINQAMGTPAGRTAAATYLKALVESIKADGFVASIGATAAGCDRRATRIVRYLRSI